MESVSKLNKSPSKRYGNKSDAAEFFDINLTTLNSWIRRGCPVMHRGARGQSYQFDLLEVAKWKFGPKNEAGDTNPEGMTPKERLDWYRGNRERDRHAQDQGLLIPFELTEQIVGAAFAAVKASLLAQHSVIAAQYPEIPTDAIRGILAANRHILEELATTQLPESITNALDALVEQPAAAAGQDSEPME